METPLVQPLPYRHRSRFFYLLLTVFLVALPFLFLYATGYRFDFGSTASLVKTGGIYIAAERSGAEIYIDNELVRETRVFRRAFYAQNLAPGTHRVHVQKDDHHTWVKELPVYPHIVTEAQSFNLPLVAQVRVISPWKDLSGATLLTASSTISASTTNTVRVSTTTIATTTHIADSEYTSLRELFDLETATTTPLVGTDRLYRFPGDGGALEATTSLATTTRLISGVRLYRHGEDVYATYIGERENMPYYYCAESFELLGTSTTPRLDTPIDILDKTELAEPEPITTVPNDAICDQTIRIDRLGQTVSGFEFFPGSTDFVIMALEQGIYVVEVDDRGWQNAQPLLLGSGLTMRVQGGNVYAYDGTSFYNVLLEQ